MGTKSIINKLSSRILADAPTKTVSENWGRQMGEYYDEDLETSGYASVLLYVQLGLSEYGDLIKEVIKLIFQVQNEYIGRYVLLPVAFGKDNKFIHNKKYFNFGYRDGISGIGSVHKEVMNLTNTAISEVPAVIPDFFPKTDARSLYSGKVKFERDDLMIIVGKKSDVAFLEELRHRFTASIKKRILFVEIEENSVNWNYRKIEPKFVLQ